MSEHDRPVITGAAAICSLGADLAEIASGLLSRRNNFQPVPFDGEAFRDRFIAPVQGVNPEDHISDRKLLRFMSRESLLAASSVARCLRDARVVVNETYAEGDIALFSGTGCSGMDLQNIEKMIESSANEETGQFDLVKFGEVGLNRMHPLSSFKILPNMPLSAAAISSGIKGQNLVFNPWEGSALLGFQEACHEIGSGREKIVLCGGSDCKTHSDAFLSFAEYGLFENSAMVMSEGSSYLVIEGRSRALERGAPIYAGIGAIAQVSNLADEPFRYSFSRDLYAQCMNKALHIGGLEPTDIGLIISSQDLNPANDAEEESAIRELFGSCPVLSPKTMTGNAFAASGYIALATAAHLLSRGVPSEGRVLHRILVNSFSVGTEKFSIVLEAA